MTFIWLNSVVNPRSICHPLLPNIPSSLNLQDTTYSYFLHTSLVTSYFPQRSFSSPRLKKNFYLLTYLAASGLSSGMWELVPWPVMDPRPPALGAWSLSHWTTSEVSQTSQHLLLTWFSLQRASLFYLHLLPIYYYLHYYPFLSTFTNLI